MKDRLSKFYQWLDLFRWMAALAVVFAHANNRVFTKVLSLPPDERSPAHFAFALLSGFAWPAVMIFFVLSGYLVGGLAVVRYRESGRLGLVDYAISRFTRLWVVLIPALALTLILNMVGIHIFDGIESGVYSVHGSEGNVTLLHDGLTASCNILFLQTAFCFQYGDNGALWSLFNEFWYYVAFPLVLLGLFSGYSTFWRLLLVGAAGALLILLGSFQFVSVAAPLAPYFLLWCLGLVIALRERPLAPMPTWLAGVLFVGYLLFWRMLPSAYLESHHLVRFGTDLVMTGLFANMLMCMKADAELPAPPLPGVNAALAAFSFSLYCINTPVLNLYSAVTMHWFSTGWKLVPDSINDYIVAFGAIAISMLAAYLFYLVTERHTPAIRSFLRGRAKAALVRRSGGAAAAKAPDTMARR